MFRPIIHSLFMLVVTISLAAAMTAEAATFDETLLSVENRWAKAACKTVGQQQGRDLKKPPDRRSYSAREVPQPTGGCGMARNHRAVLSGR
jgi:hypothetical protein